MFKLEKLKNLLFDVNFQNVFLSQNNFQNVKFAFLKKSPYLKKLKNTQIFGTLHFLASKKELPLKGTVA
jgi:hypothetical protein